MWCSISCLSRFSGSALREVLLGILRGYGKTKVPMLLSVIGMVGVRQLYLAVSMARQRDIVHIYVCYPIAWVSTLALLSVYFLLVRKEMPGVD